MEPSAVATAQPPPISTVPAPLQTERTLLQQEVIRLHAQLDRQADQLSRTNRLSDTLARTRDEEPLPGLFAEALVDVLDVAVGAAWVLDAGSGGDACAVVGARSPEAWVPHGRRIGDALKAGVVRGTVALDVLGLEAPEPDLADVIVCPILNRAGTCAGILLAGSSERAGGMSEPIADEARSMLRLLAEKFGAHLDGRDDRRLLGEQMTRVRDSEARLALVLRGTRDGWFDWLIAAGRCFVSARWLELLGDPAPADSEGGWLPAFWSDRVAPGDVPAFERMLDRELRGDAGSVEIEVHLVRRDGARLPVLVRASITRDPDGTPVRLAGSVFDLTERRRHEEHVRHLAFYDALTDLPNRRLLADRVHQAQLASTRHHQSSALILLDLDRFKLVNDLHGHAAGDQLLMAVASRLRSVVRGHDTVARLSGDEFVVLLEQIGSDEAAAEVNAAMVARKILDVLRQPFELESGVVLRGASLGVATVSDPRLGVDELLERADIAMYEAKAGGRNRYCLFRSAMQTAVNERVALEVRLQQALDLAEMFPEYQAQVDAGGLLIGAEALMRWRPAGGERIPPDHFVPVAEESGLIVPLGRQLFEAVCVQARRWLDLAPAGFRIACNLSAPEILDATFVDHVVATLADHDLPGSAIRFEITEATALRELDAVADRIRALREHGVEFSLDDFGTGFSSLTYLRRLPVSEIKIDKTYVQRLLDDDHDFAIARAIVVLGESFGLRVVAEGVESAEQLTALRRLGCRAFQGFWFAEPVPPPGSPAGLLLLDREPVLAGASWRGPAAG